MGKKWRGSKKAKSAHALCAMASAGTDGAPCPRCREPGQIREHRTITAKLLRQPFYYSRWFYCLNPHCRTKTFMLAEYQVWNNNDAARHLRQVRDQYEETEIPDSPDITMQVLDEMSQVSGKPPWEE